jgi:hypothetical protein
MRKIVTAVAVAGLLAVAGYAIAQDNTPPVCTSRTINMTGIPSYATATVTVQAAQILQQCSDANGHTLTVVSPGVPYSFQINAGQTHITSFTVSDGYGGTASGSITWTRPS